MKPACGPPYPSGTPNRCAVPDNDVRPELAGRCQQRQAQQVGGDGDEGALAWAFFTKSA